MLSCGLGVTVRLLMIAALNYLKDLSSDRGDEDP